MVAWVTYMYRNEKFIAQTSTIMSCEHWSTTTISHCLKCILYFGKSPCDNKILYKFKTHLECTTKSYYNFFEFQIPHWLHHDNRTVNEHHLVLHKRWIHILFTVWFGWLLREETILLSRWPPTLHNTSNLSSFKLCLKLIKQGH